MIRDIGSTLLGWVATSSVSSSNSTFSAPNGRRRATIHQVGAQVAQLWAGEVPLHRAFWDVAVIGGLTVNLATSMLFFS